MVRALSSIFAFQERQFPIAKCSCDQSDVRLLVFSSDLSRKG